MQPTAPTNKAQVLVTRCGVEEGGPSGGVGRKAR
jgi:hypothetical protein